MKNKDIKSLTIEELKEKMGEERTTLQRLKFAHAISSIENPMKIRDSRKLVAKIATEIRVKELAL